MSLCVCVSLCLSVSLCVFFCLCASVCVSVCLSVMQESSVRCGKARGSGSCADVPQEASVISASSIVCRAQRQNKKQVFKKSLECESFYFISDKHCKSQSLVFITGHSAGCNLCFGKLQEAVSCLNYQIKKAQNHRAHTHIQGSDSDRVCVLAVLTEWLLLC